MNGFWTNVTKYVHDLGIRIWEDDFSRGVICGLAAYFVQMFPFAGLLLLPGAIAGGVLFFREYQFDR